MTIQHIESEPQTTPVTIRAIDYRDDPLAHEAAKLIYQTVLRGISSGDDPAAAYYTRSPDVFAYCAVDSQRERLLGVAALRLSEIDPGVGYVEDVAVYRQARRQKVGAQLLGHIEHQAANVGVQELRLTSLMSALPFYEAMGYRRQSPQRGAYDLVKYFNSSL